MYEVVGPIEVGYPFVSMLDFFGKGFWLNLRSIHLELGMLLLIILSVRVFMNRQSLLSKFTVLYFSTFIFNNPAYRLFGLQFNEYMGIAGCACLFYEVLKKPDLLKRDYRDSLVGYSILAVTIIFALHAVFINMIGTQPRIYSGGIVDTMWLRTMLMGKIIVLGLMIISADLNFSTSELRSRLIRSVVAFGLVAAAVYIVQIIMCYGVGILPFGSWYDAGLTGFRSFGGVSIERGHFSKFFVPLFPFFLWGLLKEKRFLSFSLYLIIGLINFSSSGQSFLFVYILVTVVIFHKSITKFQIYIGLGIFILLGVIFYDAYIGVLKKIWDYGFLGGEKLGTVAVSGRSPQVLYLFLTAYPWGIGYGGSTLRCLDNFPANNMGIFVFLSQLSFLAIPIILGFFMLIRQVIRKAKASSDQLTFKILMIGSIVPVFIYCVDVLWFIPHIWLPLVILNRLGQPLQTEK